jgi:DNA-binding CsgD family transcriptional regulator
MQQEKKPPRPWTMGDVRRLKEMKAQRRTLAEIAQALGRGEGCLSRQWRRYGSPRPYFRPGRARDRRVRRLHAEGRTAREIALEVECHEATVRRLLRSWGLEPNRLPEEAVRELSKKRQARLDRASRTGSALHEARREGKAREAALMGWPQARTPRQAQVLGLLKESGAPMTESQIAEALGLRAAKGSRTSTRKHLVPLVRAGVVARPGKARKGSREWLYCLATDAPPRGEAAEAAERVEPVRAAPGSEGKLNAMRERYEKRQPLFQPGDAGWEAAAGAAERKG